jgi:dihydrofolate synthase/folylpolyglutamate synthase
VKLSPPFDAFSREGIKLFTAFDEALGWIHGRLKFGVKPGIERMKWFMEKLGHPEKKIKAIHIAGTNGKGSTVAFIRSILNEAGYNVGTFTSPYVVTFNERISINGSPISDEDWLMLVNDIKPLAEELEQTELGAPTEFEIITACAFMYFSMKKLDFVIIETGLGGKLDSTNVAQPVLTLITTIGYDHMAVLGNTLEKIAVEKAGIIKKGVPVITAVHQLEAYDVIRRTAEKKKAEFISFQDTCTVRNKMALPAGEKFSLETKTECYENLQTSLIGSHQRQNASLAVLSTEWLNQNQLAHINGQQIRQGLANAFWPGRFEKVSEEPPVYLDGAHNIEGIERFVDTAKEHFSGKHLYICFSALKDKPYQTMIDKLDKLAYRIHFTGFEFPRAEHAKDLYHASSHPCKSWGQQLDSVLPFIDASKKDENSVVILTGSLYFISQARSMLKN